MIIGGVGSLGVPLRKDDLQAVQARCGQWSFPQYQALLPLPINVVHLVLCESVQSVGQLVAMLEAGSPHPQTYVVRVLRGLLGRAGVGGLLSTAIGLGSCEVLVALSIAGSGGSDRMICNSGGLKNWAIEEMVGEMTGMARGKPEAEDDDEACGFTLVWSNAG